MSNFTGICLSHSDNPRYQNQWSYVLSHWNIDMVYIYDNTGASPDAFIKGSEAIEGPWQLPGNTHIALLSPSNARYVPGNKSLIEFDHPKDIIYLFGPDNVHLDRSLLGDVDIDSYIYIPVDTNYEMYSHVSAAITLYDRKLKNG